MKKETVRLRATWMPCPTCHREWPHRTDGNPEQDIDWTCPICLHATIAQLRRVLRAMNEGESR